MIRPGQPVPSPSAAAGVSVWVNGEPRPLASGTTVSEFLRELGLAEDRVAVELDGLILRRTEWSATELSGGARLEVVQFVGGG